MFAFMYVFKNYYFNVMDSRHNFYRKYISLNLSMFLALLSTFNSYITPSVYFFVLYTTIYQLGFSNASIIAAVVCLVYSIVFLSAVAGALTGRQWSKKAHIISYVLSIFTFLLMGLVVYNVLFIYLKVTSGTFDTTNLTLMMILVMTFLNLGCFLIIILIHIPSHFR